MSDNNERTTRNEVFSTPPVPPDQPPQGHQPGIQTRNVMHDDFGYDIPTECVPLPSRGVVYSFESALHGKETIDIKAMTAKEEDILTSRALIKKGTVITELIKSCIVDKNIDVEEMLVGDRNAIMTAIRVTGYGADYPIEVDCPDCGESVKQSFDLAQLAIKRLGVEPVAAGANIFETTLPKTKKTVRFKFLTGFDERELMTISERKKKQGKQTDSLVTERYNRQLVSVGSVTDKNKINHFIRNMPAGDSLHLRKFIDKVEPGIDMKGWLECPQCGEQSEVRLPMGASFFWPDAAE